MSAQIIEITEDQLPAESLAAWQRAITAVQANNFGYAVSQILPIVQANPGFLDARKTLRTSEGYVSGSAEKKSGGLFGIGGNGVPSKVKSLAKKDAVACLAEIEKELEEDPFDAALNEVLHDVALASGMIETAEFALETIREHAPQHTKLVHKLAEYYISVQKFAEAAQAYKTILQVAPTDSVAVKGEKDCMAKSSMKRGNWESGNNDSMRANTSQSLQLEQAARVGMTKDQLATRRDELVEAYNANQNDLNTVRQLAEVYEQLKDWQNAHSFFAWAYQLSEGDSSIQKKADTMKAKATSEYIQQLEAAIAADPENADLQAQLAEVNSSRIAERVQECEARIEENPTDPTLRYDLGKALYEAGRAGDAIPHLQQAKSNPAIETKVLLLLGKTFDAKGMLDMAVKQLEKANEKLLAMDSTKKDVLYEYALLLEKADKKEESLNALKEIYEVDYGYRDVATRVEAAY